VADPLAAERDAERDADGRRRRAERSRAAVVDALLSLYDDGVVRPGAAEVAERAGVSTRSVFRHFADLEALAQAAIDRQWARVHELFEPPSAEGDVQARAAALVDQRLRLHAAIIGVARAAVVLALSSATVAATMRERHRLLAGQVAELFAPELRVLRPPERRELGAALEATASLEHVDYLRTHAGLSDPDAGAVVRRTLLALLAELLGGTRR
jgi:TetR/AcrR family transcriptional regulator, regulator of autoinduction and epiphytic fitness